MHVILRRAGLVIGALCALVVLVAAGGFAVSQRHVTRQYDIAPESIPIPTDSLSIERGRHLARAIAKCTDCHGEDLSGRVMVDNGAMGRWAPPNITSGKGGLGTSLHDDDYVRAIRHAVGRDGRALLVMPALDYQYLSVGDLGAIIAYVKSVPSVDREMPPSNLGAVARGLIAAGKLPIYDAEVIDHSSRAVVVAPMPEATAEFGKYMVSVGGCAGCHGPTLAGGHIDVGDPAWPPAANLTPTGLKAYDEAAFFKVLRTGVRASGAKLNDAMPWIWTREMTDDEIRAIWLYLRTVTPRELGAR